MQFKIGDKVTFTIDETLMAGIIKEIRRFNGPNGIAMIDTGSNTISVPLKELQSNGLQSNGLQSNGLQSNGLEKHDCDS
jgi:ribosomal protein L21E